MRVSASIVLYKTNRKELKDVINSFFSAETFDNVLYLVDNSPTNNLINIVNDYPNNNIKYIYNHANLGYGAAHNIAIRESIKQNILYHIVLNPDIIIKQGVIKKLYVFMKENDDIGNIMPKILYPNNEIQYLCKLLPTPIDLIFRRFIPLKKWKEKRNNKYELKFTNYDKVMNIPNLSGCFMFLSNKALKDIGLFDEQIFMYLEDVDLNRRIHNKYKTLFYPHAEVIHKYKKESYNSKTLLKAHVKSAIYYFNKWGWFFDIERKRVNKQTLQLLHYKDN